MKIVSKQTNQIGIIPFSLVIDFYKYTIISLFEYDSYNAV